MEVLSVSVRPCLSVFYITRALINSETPDGAKRSEIYTSCALVALCVSLAVPTFSPEMEKVE